ncbi:MAG: Unknown protein [uncultured Sulfurovum sp.]|uniref:DUF1800 domain-containing protein n=1 Tax=uncultured Sulfurovum sp. TaxID=269237 RepID=A0A6S6SMB2_9BACT|nr:MAG: Unknown protein [uncultured Sulfurovum sp.]
MKKIFIGLAFLLNFSFSGTLELQSGWNLVGINAPLTIEELKTQIGEDNLLIVQGESKTYQKEYIDDNTPELNDFTAFEEGKGYWLEIESNATLMYPEIVNNESSYVRTLTEGWNLLNAPVGLTISELIRQIGEENLLVIQGSEQTYQRSYSVGGNAHLNDLDTLSIEGGYWIKVASSVNLEFVFNMDQLALNNLGETLVSTMEFNSSVYTLKVYTNVVPNDVISLGSIALFGTVNDVDTASTFKLNSNYEVGTDFIVKVYNAQNEEVAKSYNVKYITSPIDFGAIDFTIVEEETTEQNDEQVSDVEFQGVNVFSSRMAYRDYALEAITDDEFNALSLENKRLVASKLFSVLFYGLPRTEFDNLINSGTFITTVQTMLSIDNNDLTSTEKYIEEKSYNGNERNANREKILARLLHLGLGKHYFNRLSAYLLTQDIMFSPANELETVGATDILNVYNRLVMLMDEDYSMQMITYLHMTSDDNWKRFRSPEDNGREMLEIFLLDFNDSHVPRAGIALQNWSLNRNENELLIGLNQNDVPQELFGTTVTTGFDFYRELVKTDDFRKGVSSRLVARYFPEVTSEKKSEIVASIISSKPNTFQDILLQIIFSKEFLLHTEKIKTIEETVYPLMKTISFYDRLNFFSYMREYMDNMHQSPMYYKLGRVNVVPVDTLSFAYYYDFIRRYIMIDRKTDLFNEWDSGWQADFINKSIAGTDTVSGLINHVFLVILGREASSDELIFLSNYAVVEARGTYDDMTIYNDRQGVTLIAMEYIARLTELYTFKMIEE